MKPATIAVVAALGILYPAVAWSCINGLILETDDARKRVARAEQLVSSGNHREAGQVLRNRGEYWFQVGDRGLMTRRQRVLAEVDLRAGRLAPAIRSFRTLRKLRPDDPYLDARYAEALAGTQRGRPEALRILEDLERRDLIPDEHAWAALARLRDWAGDPAGSDRATTRCGAACS
jgi:tetratricopeptide (TPR) repeat protein